MGKAKLRVIDNQRPHDRDLARQLVARYRKGTALDSTYDFNAQPREQRQIVYNAAVRFHCRRGWWARLRGLR